jgi:hypothetical protein
LSAYLFVFCSGARIRFFDLKNQCFYRWTGQECSFIIQKSAVLSVLRPLSCPLVTAEGNMTIQELEKRFGTIAVEKGFITLQQLMDALEIQVRENLAGAKHRLIGDILFDVGFLTEPQIEEVLKSMS